MAYSSRLLGTSPSPPVRPYERASKRDPRSMAREVLNHDQFARSGGSSRSFATGESAGPGGYFVSRHPDAGHEKVVNGPATAVQVAAHWAANRQQALAGTHDPRSAHQGLWEEHQDDGSTKSYLDVSDKVHSFNVAVKRGLDNQQHAIYDNVRGASVFLNPNGESSPVQSRPSPSRSTLRSAGLSTGSGLRASSRSFSQTLLAQIATLE